MQVSRGAAWSTPGDVKSVAVASTRGARQRLATSMKALGILVKLHTRNLGFDYEPGRRARKRVVMLARWQKVKMKTKKCKKVGHKASLHVTRTALLPALSYGVACTSFPSGLLRDFRGVVAQMAGPLHGRSATARLALRNCEPSFVFVLEPLKAWWKAIWTQILPLSMLTSALSQAEEMAERAGHLHHCHVAGGAGAYLSSLRRIGWKMLGVDGVVTDREQTLRLGVDCDPKMLLRMASSALERRLSVESRLSDELSSIHVPDGNHRAASRANHFAPMGSLPGFAEHAQAIWWDQFQHHDGKLIPWLRPAIDAVKEAARRGRSAASIGSFIALIEGGWWTQARLHHCGLASDPFCRWCGEDHGTLWHRLSRICKSSASDRPTIVQEGMSRWWDPLFARGIPALPLMPGVPDEEVWCYPPEAGQQLLTGDLYTDGAMRGLHPDARRGGWAFAMLGSSREEIRAVFYGICVEPWLTVVRTELRAMEEALRRACALVTVYTDNAAVVNAFVEGKTYACRAGNDGADIWRGMFTIREGFGDFCLLKVKAHTVEADVVDGFILCDKLGMLQPIILRSRPERL